MRCLPYGVPHPLTAHLMDDDVNAPIVARTAPWGLVATILFAVLIGGAYLMLQFAVLALLVWAGGPEAAKGGATHGLVRLRDYGDVLTFGLLVSAAGGGTLLLLIVRARRGLRVRDYLAWRRVPLWQFAFWIAILLLYIVAWETLARYLGHQQTPAFMETAYRTTHFLPLLWLAIIVVAPLFEELFFRGFLFAGIAASRLGVTGAVLLTAALWAGLHMQYKLYDMTSVFLLGLMFAIARHRSGSLWPSLSMHIFANLVATVETALKLMG